MANNVSRLEVIDQQTRELARSIEESVAELAAQISSLNDRYRRLTGGDIANVEVSGGRGMAKRGPGRPPKNRDADSAARSGGAGNTSGNKSGGKKSGAKR